MYKLGQPKRYSGHKGQSKPLQTVPSSRSQSPKQFSIGVGTEIKTICEQIGIAECSACREKAQEWNSKGISWCRENRSQLVTWMVSQGKRKKVSLLSAATKLTVNEPLIATSIAAKQALHPLTDTAVIAAEVMVDCAIDRAQEQIDGLRITGDIPLIVSMAPRESGVHKRTFSAAHDAGFYPIIATCEPETDTDAIPEGVLTIQQTTKQGQWQNLIQALRLGVETESPYFITLEDDVELCRGTSDLIRKLGWPEDKCGCVQLYTSFSLRHYARGRRSQLLVQDALDMLGACALLFSRKAANDLVEWADTKGWRGDSVTVVNDPSKKKAGDTFVGEVLTFLKYTIWMHNPTLANHIGVESTLGHHVSKSPNRQQLNFPGIDADLNAIFSRDIQCVS